MKRTKLIESTMALMAAMCIIASVRAVDEAARPGKPIPEALRDQWKNLTPEERQARMRELREKHPEGPNREEMEKRREEFKNLSPEERQAKMKEWREKRGDLPGLQILSPEAREAKRKELRARLEKHRTALLKKKADGTLTAQEEKRLQHMEELAKRFEKGGFRPGPRSFYPKETPSERPGRPATVQ